HAHEARLAVDLRAARAALARLAVPSARQVRGLGGLKTMDDVEHDHALLGLDAVVLELTAARVAPEHPHGVGRHLLSLLEAGLEIVRHLWQRLVAEGQ